MIITTMGTSLTITVMNIVKREVGERAPIT
jgi:hypothetical protein